MLTDYVSQAIQAGYEEYVKMYERELLGLPEDKLCRRPGYTVPSLMCEWAIRYDNGEAFEVHFFDTNLNQLYWCEIEGSVQ